MDSKEEELTLKKKKKKKQGRRIPSTHLVTDKIICVY